MNKTENINCYGRCALATYQNNKTTNKQNYKTSGNRNDKSSDKQIVRCEECKKYSSVEHRLKLQVGKFVYDAMSTMFADGTFVIFSWIGTKFVVSFA